jgi:hypothetical protein
MASPQSSEHALSRMKATMYDFDYSNAAVDVAWVDMQHYRSFTAIAFLSVPATGAIGAFSLLANAQSNGGGTDVTVKTHALGSSPDAVGDYVVLSCTAEEIAQEAADAGVTGARYVSASLALSNAGAEAVVTYILCEPRFASTELTADYIS